MYYLIIIACHIKEWGSNETLR